jgi:hypothetical protein
VAIPSLELPAPGRHGHRLRRWSTARTEKIIVDVRIGVTQAPRELTVEIPDEEREDTVKQIEVALSGAVDVLWLTDKRGRRIGVPAAKIAYVELGTNDGDRRIGFGG